MHEALIHYIYMYIYIYLSLSLSSYHIDHLIYHPSPVLFPQVTRGPKDAADLRARRAQRGAAALGGLAKSYMGLAGDWALELVTMIVIIVTL